MVIATKKINRSEIFADLDLLARLHSLPEAAALTTGEAAIFLRSSVSALEAMRASGAGPAYSQAGARGVTGANQKCLYEKADLLAWIRSNKVISTMEAAARKGQLFRTVFDVVSIEPFWIDSKGLIAGMVERASITAVLARLGVFDITWLPAIDAVSSTWADLAQHEAFASEIESVFASELGRARAGLEATALSVLLS